MAVSPDGNYIVGHVRQNIPVEGYSASLRHPDAQRGAESVPDTELLSSGAWA